MYHCHICGAEYRTYRGLRNHQARAPKHVKCPVCGRVFAAGRSMGNHKTSVGHGPKYYDQATGKPLA